ncbi:hypothetical protein SYNPS1DRAFT_26425 [Syncephalis pseudoplumigaleata]|uniref:RBR-type E3 ubiquitin transferase n=1 Tax=Syncephalis pseudoplumigaleata TaxID=1712513 RepID=A0A4P9Z5Y5_9FUNG|nr:hypothetical protein SYNPS1DRAFT_26425 [Syncephalis pseudoplumigaleata]|eukprot:RKP27945.1 hypothetical protein SYNPS1DRAFT_26425 [Syncephalis pseudoplumigaleata]
MSDEQDDEMTALKAIFDDAFEYGRNAAHEYTGKLTVSVNVPAEASILMAGSIESDGSRAGIITRSISALPPVTLFFTLAAAYPKGAAPQIAIACVWLSAQQRAELARQMHETWTHEPDVILFHCADLLQNVFDRISVAFPLVLADDVAEMVIEHDRAQQQQRFDATRHNCGICLEDKLGAVCYALSCGHVFCRACLTEFFALHINEGNVAAVQCPDHACIKFGAKLLDSDIVALVGHALHRRYSEIVEKRALDTDPSITWCPRRTCEGSAQKDAQYEKLAICRKCGYAFCFYCRRSWHGTGQFCAVDNHQRITREYSEASDEMKRYMELKYGASTLRRIVSDAEQVQETNRWLEENTTTCPTCHCSIQKAFGCNHMTCSVCGTHFCYLCGAYLTPNSVLDHFNVQGGRCGNRLFEDLGADPEQLFLDAYQEEAAAAAAVVDGLH